MGVYYKLLPWNVYQWGLYYKVLPQIFVITIEGVYYRLRLSILIGGNMGVYYTFCLSMIISGCHLGVDTISSTSQCLLAYIIKGVSYKLRPLMFLGACQRGVFFTLLPSFLIRSHKKGRVHCKLHLKILFFNTRKITIQNKLKRI